MVTGGEYSLQRVTQYSLTGEVTELPDLNTGRYYHACSSFQNTEGVTVSYKYRNVEYDYSYFQTLLVTGGYDGYGYYYLSSTEIFTLDMKDWISAGSLPSPRDRLSGATVRNSVYVFGKIYNLALHLS